MYLEKFAKNLKIIMSDKNMNQTQLAKAMGVNKTAVFYWVNAQKEPSLSNICKIMKALNCTFEELVE